MYRIPHIDNLIYVLYIKVLYIGKYIEICERAFGNQEASRRAILTVRNLRYFPRKIKETARIYCYAFRFRLFSVYDVYSTRFAVWWTIHSNRSFPIFCQPRRSSHAACGIFIFINNISPKQWKSTQINNFVWIFIMIFRVKHSKLYIFQRCS